MNKKIISGIVIGLILLITIIVLISLIINKKNEQIKNATIETVQDYNINKIQTYTNQQYGFSFQYPSGAKIIEAVEQKSVFDAKGNFFPNDPKRYCILEDGCLLLLGTLDVTYNDDSIGYSHGNPISKTGAIIRIISSGKGSDSNGAPMVFKEDSWQEQAKTLFKANQSSDTKGILENVNSSSVEIFTVNYSEGSDVVFFSKKSQQLIVVSYRTHDMENNQNDSVIKMIGSTIKTD